MSLRSQSQEIGHDLSSKDIPVHVKPHRLYGSQPFLRVEPGGRICFLGYSGQRMRFVQFLCRQLMTFRSQTAPTSRLWRRRTSRRGQSSQ